MSSRSRLIGYLIVEKSKWVTVDQTLGNKRKVLINHRGLDVRYVGKILTIGDQMLGMWVKF